VKWIMLLLLGAAGAQAATYYGDVKPILEKNCVTCHQAGQVAPFALDNYADAAKRAKMIAAVTAAGRMPIWKPEAGYGTFHDERRLSPADLAVLKDWAKGGASEGKRPVGESHQVRPRQETPDLRLRMPVALPVAASGPDQFVCVVVPVPTDGDRWVRRVEFHPGNPRVVHHSLFFLMAEAEAQKRAGTKGYYPCFGGPGGLPQGALGGWAPGAMPRELPPGTARLLPKGMALVMQQHYHPSGKPETDQSELLVYFAKGPVDKRVVGMAVRTRDIDIPAGQAAHVVKASLDLPVSVNVLGITPHMHYVGKSMKVTALTPDGRRVPLIWIKDWDFNWQGQYQFAQPLELPAGTRIEMEALYDNSAGNPNNPSRPPKRVSWGEQTTDEMAICFLEYTSADKNAQRKVFLSMLKAEVRSWF
jgi:hypothetical protein